MIAGLAVTATAAGMLVETLILANRIDANVTPISQSVGDIKLHTDTISVLTNVDRSAAGIRQAAAPLSGQASSILGTVGSIQSTVASIDGSTGSINGLVSQIDGTVSSITSHALSITTSVEGIEAKLPTTVGIATQALSVLNGIKADTAAMLVAPELPTINAHANSIDCKLGPGGDCQR
jgi:prophage DNA circulation protein